MYCVYLFIFIVLFLVLGGHWCKVLKPLLRPSFLLLLLFVLSLLSKCLVID